jgi:two-component system, sporulation sensor kinase E
MLDIHVKAILDNSPESIVLIGKNHEVLAFNRTIANVLKQYHGREIRIDDLYYPDFVIEPNKQLYLDTFERAIKGESVTVENQTQNENVSIWFEYRMTPVYADDRELIGVTLSAKDITTKKKYEIRLKESEERFRKISNLAPIGILITDKDLGIVYANNAMHKIFDYEFGELTNLSLSELIVNFSMSADKRIILDQVGFEISNPLFFREQFEAKRKDAQKVDILLSSSSFYSQDHLYYIFIIQDITDAVIKEDLIAQQNSKLRDIAWYQAHVIRAPLSNIMGIVSLLDDENIEMNKLETDTMHKALIQSAKELDKVVRDIVKKTE